VQETHEAWIDDLQALVREADRAGTIDAFWQSILAWQSRLPKPAYASALGDAIALAELKGRAEIIDEMDGPALAEPTIGKDGPDTAPTRKMHRVKDPTTGEWVKVPEGIDFGWDYQPGDTWERGLVPREWQKPLALTEPELPLPVSPPLTDLGRPFAAPELPDGREPEYYVGRFLSKFGAAIGQGVMYRDQAGQAVLISDALFRNMDGAWKAMKRGRAVQIERLAEAIFDPDEIWVDWGEDQDGMRRLVRRYLRWDPELAAFSLFEWGRIGWSGLTSFDPRAGSRRKPARGYLENQRRGALIYRRGE
jgi:hypothetical protein